MQKLIIPLIVAALVIGGVFFLLKDDNSSAVVVSETEGANSDDGRSVSPEPTAVHKMVLGEEGYEPRDITISIGEAVEFSTTQDKPFWPASNVHPTHRLLSAFDPKDPVQPEDTWQFTFDQAGEWRYHDHLAPFYTGVITVLLAE